MDDCAANLNRAYLAQVTITAPDKRLLTEFERQIGRRIAAVRSMIMRFDDFQDACPEGPLSASMFSLHRRVVETANAEIGRAEVDKIIAKLTLPPVNEPDDLR